MRFRCSGAQAVHRRPSPLGERLQSSVVSTDQPAEPGLSRAAKSRRNRCLHRQQGDVAICAAEPGSLRLSGPREPQHAAQQTAALEATRVRIGAPQARRSSNPATWRLSCAHWSTLRHIEANQALGDPPLRDQHRPNAHQVFMAALMVEEDAVMP